MSSGEHARSLSPAHLPRHSPMSKLHIQIPKLGGKEGPPGFLTTPYPVINTKATITRDFVEELQAALVLLEQRQYNTNYSTWLFPQDWNMQSSCTLGNAFSPPKP